MVLSLLMLGCNGLEPDRSPQPDILLITLDTLRADALGCYGNPLETTPNLDALAARGARFERAYTVTPLTIPAHSSLFTGLYPPRHGVRDNGDFFLSEAAVTLAERFKQAGYATMASVGAEVTSHHWGFDQGFDVYHDELEVPGVGGSRWKVERPGSQVLADALPWWSADREGPSFGWIHLFDAHDPYEPREPWRTLFPNRPYLAEVAGVDELVGQILAAVDDNTVVVVAADHGEGLGDHGEALHGALLYDSTTRIPLLVAGPGIDPASVDVPVSLVDVMPTLLGLAGLQVPEGLDGSDLSAALRGEAWPRERAVYLESLYGQHHYGWAAQHGLVDTGYKLIDSRTDKLFARADRREQTNLAERSKLLKPRLERLQALLAQMEPSHAAERVAGHADLVGQLEALGYMTAEALPVDDPPDPEDKLPSLKRVEALRQAMRAEDFATVEELATALIAEEPGLAEPRTLLAAALTRLGKLDAAREVLTELLSRRESSGALTQLGLVELNAGYGALAITHFERAVELDPYQATAWVPYLHTLIVTGSPELAVQADRAMSLLPEQPAIYGLYGMSLVAQDRGAEAEPLLRRALEARPESRLLRLGLARVLEKRGDSEGAVVLLLEEIEHHPPAPQSRRMLVELYAAAGRHQEQLDQLSVLIELQPKDPMNWHSVAQARFNLQDYDTAYRDVLTCRRLAPEYPGCAMLEANCLKKLGEPDRAQAAYDHALELMKQLTEE